MSRLLLVMFALCQARLSKKQILVGVSILFLSFPFRIFLSFLNNSEVSQRWFEGIPPIFFFFFW